MRILFVTLNDWVPYGGSEILWAETALLLTKKGVETAVSIKKWQPEPLHIKHLTGAGSRVRFRCHQTAFEKLLAKNSLFAVAVQNRPMKWIQKWKPDLTVVSLGFNLSGTEWFEAFHRTQLSYALIIQSASESRWPHDSDRDKRKKIYRNAIRCFFVSEANRRLTECQLGLELPNARLVRNPFGVRFEANPDWPVETGTWRLACVGRLEVESKGQDLLFQVLRQEKWKSRNLTISLFGRGFQESALQELKKLWGLEKIHFKGQTEDIEAVWAQHHGLILPSRQEGLPLAIVEAMLCNRISIATKVAGNPEVVEEGLTGFLAAAPTPQHLDEALERAWTRRGEWKSLGENAGKRIRQLVPQNPVEMFATELQRLLSGDSSKGQEVHGCQEV